MLRKNNPNRALKAKEDVSQLLFNRKLDHVCVSSFNQYGNSTVTLMCTVT